MLRTLEDCHSAGEDIQLPRDPKTIPFGRPKYQCDGCGGWSWPWLLVDVRSVSGVPHDWACDGCRSTWERDLTPVDGGVPSINRKEWVMRFLNAVKQK